MKTSKNIVLLIILLRQKFQMTHYVSMEVTIMIITLTDNLIAIFKINKILNKIFALWSIMILWKYSSSSMKINQFERTCFKDLIGSDRIIHIKFLESRMLNRYKLWWLISNRTIYFGLYYCVVRMLFNCLEVYDAFV